MKSEQATILDMCCGSRMFWFDKADDRAVFADIRDEEHMTLASGCSADDVERILGLGDKPCTQTN